MSSYLDYEGLGLYHENNKNYIDGKIPTKTSELTNDSNFVNTNTLNTSLNTKAPKEHTHEISDVDGLQDELDNYASKTDIPTLVAGSNITLTPNTDTNEITISSTSGGSGSSDASDINYDNTTSGLSATEVQSAIDELNSNLGNFSDSNHRTNYFNGDLNDITENGIVNCEPTETQNKPPVSQWFFVLTMAHSYSSDYITQVAFTMNSQPYEDSIWLRQKGAGAWGAWGKIGDAVKPLLSDRCVGFNISFETLISSQTPIYFTNWHDSTNFPELYGSGILIPGLNSNNKYLLYVANNREYFGHKIGADAGIVWHDLINSNDLSNYSKLIYSSSEPTNNLSTNMIWIG